jgi:mono/diheme cytochrome c family protein
MRKVLKWLGYLAGGVVALLLVSLGVVYAISESKLGTIYTIDVGHVSVPNDPMAIERGKHLATAIMKCVDCHGDNLGGRVAVDDPLLGRLTSRNLTSGKGGIGKTFSDADWFRAIRHGVGSDKHGLKMMPADDYYNMSDEEVGDVVAYIKSLPPVNSDTLPETTFRPFGRLLYVLGAMPLVQAENLDHKAERRPAPAPSVSVEYGKHLSETGGCVGCHGPTFSGGKIPGAPPDWVASQNLTPDPVTGIGKWTEQDFFRALREGKRPDGTTINTLMPWKYTAKMKDDEIRALWLFLRTLPAKPAGNR